MSDTRPVTPETIEVKRRGRHRLIGAITLAVLAVVIIPMVLDSEPRKVAKQLSLSIPDKDGQPALAAPAPETTKPAAEAPKPAPEESSQATNPEAKPEQAASKAPAKAVVAVAVEPKQVEAKSEPKAPKAEPKVSPAKPAEKSTDKPDVKSEKPAAKMEGFAIQLGAFSDADKLAALKAKMKTAKVAVFTEEVKTSAGKLTRLRAGPYKTREQADKALAQVKKAGVDGKVVPLP